MWQRAPYRVHAATFITPLGGGLQHCVAVGGVRPEWATALQCGGELCRLAVVEFRARIVRAIGERVRGPVEGEPRVGAERGAVGRAVLVHLGGSAEITHHRPLAGS